ncbi:hypothetical protein BAB75_13880 [Mycobacteroides immunogenum]|nr:hypothetical protein BAB75_13880 [Mycobacteroides immunogenum]
MADEIGMDWLSKLLRQSQPGARIDTRCQLPAGARRFHDAVSGSTAPFHLVVEGQCDIVLNERILAMRAGDFLLLPRGQEHEIRISGNANAGQPRESVSVHYGQALAHVVVGSAVPTIDLFCGHYSFETGAGHVFLAGIPNPLQVNVAEASPSGFRDLVSLLRLAADNDKLGASVMLDSLAQVLLVLALQVDSTDHVPSILKATDTAVRAAIAAVVAQPGEKWTVDRIAEVCCVSRSTLVRRFRSDTGATVADFVTWVRVMYAADLLRKPGYSVANVSDTVGYSSASAFSKAFQSAIGISPGRYALR